MDIGAVPCDMYVDISGQDCDAGSKLSDAIAALAPGKVLLAVSQKAALQCDVPAYCRQAQLQLVDQGEAEQQCYFLIRK